MFELKDPFSEHIEQGVRSLSMSGAWFLISTGTSTSSSTRPRSRRLRRSQIRSRLVTQRRGTGISRSSRPADRSTPFDLLKDAGVDMTTDEPLNLAIKEMSRVMDEMEAILASRPNSGSR